jgi:hypothetical protein
MTEFLSSKPHQNDPEVQQAVYSAGMQKFRQVYMHMIEE